MITHNGVSYPSVRALAKAHRKPYSTVCARLQRGATIAEALAPPMSCSDRGRLAAARIECRPYAVPAELRR